MNYEFNATRAKEITMKAHTLQGLFLQEQTSKALDIIRAAVTRGETYVSIPYTHTVILKRLEELGFIIDRITRDQRHGDYTTISW